MTYCRRIIDDLLDELFPHLAAIALEGAKGVGKSATAAQRAATVLTMDDPRQRLSVESHLDLLVTSPPPVLVDEWQLYPPVWDRVKRAVDEDQTGGRILLAGSAGVPPEARVHSGAGRIVSLRMRPMSFAERIDATATVSLHTLLSGTRPAITGTTDIDLPSYVDELLRSGFPGIRGLPPRARRAQLDSYLARIVERELPDNGVEVRKPRALRAWLGAYGAATSTDASYTSVLDAATAGEPDKPSRQTVDGYREHLTRLFILDPLPAWTPMFAPLKRLAASPKHHLVDPALAARLVGIDADGLITGRGEHASPSTGTWLGALYESLVTQSVRVYADAAEAHVGHLRSRDSAREIDLVVEGPDRRLVAIEVKLSPLVEDKDVRHLLWLREKIGDRVADLVVVTTGPYAYRRRDGVAVVPLALLGP